MQYDAERVDIGEDADRFAADLLGGGVRRRHQLQYGAGLIRSPRVAIELLGDSKIEQLDFAFVLDQDVGRLQIAMNDRVLMRVLHGFAYGAEQSQALGDGAYFIPRVLGERHAQYSRDKECSI